MEEERFHPVLSGQKYRKGGFLPALDGKKMEETSCLLPVKNGKNPWKKPPWKKPANPD